jgi:hypothetical protein
MADKVKKFLTNNILDISEALQGLKLPGKLVTANISTAAVKVGKNNIIKVHVAADTYMAFSDDAAFGAVSVTTDPGLLLNAGMHYVICTGEYVRASANPSRIELLEI